MEYTNEMKKDIMEREAKALEMLKELQLSPAASIGYINIGNDTFATKMYPYLSDLKYAVKEGDIPSSIEIKTEEKV